MSVMPRRPLVTATTRRGKDESATTAGGPLTRGLWEIGDLATFAIRSARALPRTAPYVGETLKQAGTLIAGSALVIMAMQLVIGGECGLFTSYFTRSFGAAGAVGVFTEICSLREMFPYMFGYILAAKVGCGLVAEIGSMRISEEIDAIECLGINPMHFVAATRLLAAMMAIPIIYAMSLLTGTLGIYVVVVQQVGDVSGGAWAAGHFGPIHSYSEDLLSMCKAMVIGIAIVIVGIYYGFKVQGGPAEVGSATARSMVVNLVLIHVLGGMMSAAFWGATGNLPFGG